LLLFLANAVITGARVPIYYYLEGQAPIFISQSNRLAQLYRQTLVYLFVSYELQGYDGSIELSS
jgi:hypothetical protein